MHLHSVVMSGPGKVRDTNEDNFYLNGTFRADPADTAVQCFEDRTLRRALYAVADGMGGEAEGEAASLMAVRQMPALRLPLGTDGMTDYLLSRNEEICRHMARADHLRCGSTFVSLEIDGMTATVMNIGDSRAYLFRDARLKQLTLDHTRVRQMVEMGILSSEAARSHPDRSKLTQHLGIFPEEMIIQPFAANCQLLPGDVFLLCSDGLYDMVEEKALEQTLSGAAGLAEAAQRLYDAAMAAGGRDNITVLLVHADL